MGGGMLLGGARDDPGVGGGTSEIGVLSLNLIDLDGWIVASLGVLAWLDTVLDARRMGVAWPPCPLSVLPKLP